MPLNTDKPLSYVWDCDLSLEQFEKILNDELRLGHLDSDWAAVRLLDYAPYGDIEHQIGFKRLVKTWSRWKNKVRSQTRKRGLDFLVSWLPKHHTELL